MYDILGGSTDGFNETCRVSSRLDVPRSRLTEPVRHPCNADRQQTLNQKPGLVEEESLEIRRPAIGGQLNEGFCRAPDRFV